MRHVRLAALLALGAIATPFGRTTADESPPAASGAVIDATVLPVSGPTMRRGTVIWRDGKIDAVGSELEVPDGVTVHRGTGLYVVPGFVAVTAAGLGVQGTDGIEHSLDPYDLELRIALASGITTAQLIQQRFAGGFGRDAPVPQGSASAIIKLTHGDLGAMFVRAPGCHYLSMPRRQVEMNLFSMREKFRQAADHLAKVAEAKASKGKPPAMPRGLNLYVDILKNERRTIVDASGPRDVEAFLELQEEFGFDAVLYNPLRAWRQATTLAVRGVPVLVKVRGPDFDFSLSPGEAEREGLAAIRLPSVFSEAGVAVSILPYRRGVSLSGLAGRDLSALPFSAAFAVRGGMSDEEALRAITLQPARVLEIDDRVGSLEKGKDADLLIMSGHPLDYRAYVLKAFINGKLYYDRSTSRLFREVPLHGRRPQREF